MPWEQALELPSEAVMTSFSLHTITPMRTIGWYVSSSFTHSYLL